MLRVSCFAVNHSGTAEKQPLAEHPQQGDDITRNRRNGTVCIVIYHPETRAGEGKHPPRQVPGKDAFLEVYSCKCPPPPQSKTTPERTRARGNFQKCKSRAHPVFASLQTTALSYRRQQPPNISQCGHHARYSS